jgi:hypothetical protein
VKLGRVLFLVVPLCALGGGFAACSSTAPPVGSGGECFTATDCAAGLVCLPPTCNGGKQLCSADVTCVQTTIDAGGVDAGMRPEAMPPGDAPMGETNGDGPPPPDTGPADMGTPDMGTPDMGTPDMGPVDMGAPDTGGG